MFTLWLPHYALVTQFLLSRHLTGNFVTLTETHILSLSIISHFEISVNRFVLPQYICNICNLYKSELSDIEYVVQGYKNGLFII